MRTITSIDFWRRWSVTALGALLFGLIMSTIVTINIEWTLIHHLQFVIPILLSIGLITYGSWLVQCELPPERIPRIAIWSLAGTVVIGSFATWEMFIHLTEGEPFIAALHELMLGGTQGAIVGGGIGYYDAQRREQHQETKQAHQAISASIDGIAILDEDGRYTNVNQAHADAYGYEGPEDFLGESWRMCYTDDKVAEFEEQVWPVLERDGEWRGETIGKRCDESTFPQEVTLTALDDGGLVCVVRDISERREQERELERKTDLFEKTQRMATVGGWELDLRADELQWTDEIHRIYELPLDYEPELKSALEFFHPEDAHRFEDAVDRAIEDGESYDFELRLITANDNLRWVHAMGEPYQENGETIRLRGVFQDITRQKRQTQALEEAEGRFRALTDSAEFGVVTIDQTSTIQYANDALEAVLGYQPEELEGESITNLMPGRFRDDHRSGIQRYLGEGTRDLDWDWIELPGLHKDGHEVPLGISFGETQLEDGTLFTGILRDITEQTERENQIASLHEASRQLMYAKTPEEVASVTVEIASQVLDKPLSTMWQHDEETKQLVSTATTDSTQELLSKAGITELPPILEGELGMDVFRDGELTIIEDYETVENPAFSDLPLGSVIIVPIGDHGILELGAESVDEITETDRHQINILALNAQAALDRAQREQTLIRRKEMIESLHSVTRDMVGVADVEEICELAVDAAKRLLGIPNVAIWISDDTDRRLEPITQSLESEALIGELPVYTPDGESLSWQAFETGETGVYGDLRTESGVSNPETPIRSEIIVPLGDHGVLNFGSQTSHTFNETEVRIAELLGANMVTALERVEREQELRQQRNSLERVHQITDTLQSINQILVRAGDREEIEQGVCNQLASSASYMSAWIGEYITENHQIEPHAWAGVEANSHSKMDITADEIDPGTGLAGEAARTQSVQAVQNIRDDPSFEPWREQALERGYRAAAAVPLVYGETIYGVLTVYSGRPFAFDDHEQALLGDLGKRVGHTMYAAENRRLLHTDTVVELEFQSTSEDALFVRLSEELDCRFELKNLTPTSNGAFVCYASMEGAAPDRVHDRLMQTSTIDDARVMRATGETCVIEFTLAGASPAIMLANHGATITEAVAEQGEETLVGEITPDTDTRTIIKQMQTRFPGTEFVSKRTIDRPTTPDRYSRGETINDVLTERQQEVLEVAYHAGFFASPRDSTGEELADTLDIASPTFYQHVRKATQKLLETTLMDESRR